MQFGLKTETIERIRAVFKTYLQIDSVIIYGSRAKGNFRAGSDIDLALTGKQLDLKFLSKISDDLDELMTPYKFDLTPLDIIKNQALLDHINTVGIKFYQKQYL